MLSDFPRVPSVCCCMWPPQNPLCSNNGTYDKKVIDWMMSLRLTSKPFSAAHFKSFQAINELVINVKPTKGSNKNLTNCNVLMMSLSIQPSAYDNVPLRKEVIY